MDCPDCEGKDKVEGVNCFRCNGTGELCDICGEAINVCEGIHDEEE